jgi:N-acetylglutamate synthase-like GNAT family acetyltransferase
VADVVVRSATEADQPVIAALIRGARLNPRNLHWTRFLVAEDAGRIVGVRQVRVHSAGTREVASGFVIPEYRRRGISARLMREILARERGPLYLMADEKWVPYYEPFDFRQVSPAALPRDFAGEYRMGRIVTTILTVFAAHRVRIVPMRREAHPML